MSSDDEVSVVYHEGYWYVDVTAGDNYRHAITYGKKFATKEKALLYAHSLGWTEYGIQVYD